MAGRRTNLALAVLLLLALVSGGLSFATGTAAARWPVLAHGVLGLAIVILAPWKAVIARRGLGRSRPGRWASVVLAILTGTAVVSGVLFSTGINLRYGPLNAMQVHVGSALATIPFAVHHLWRRPVRPQRFDVARRNLLRAGGLAGVAGVAWLGVEAASRLLRLPGRRRRFTGSHERGSHDPAAMPATQWFDDSPPDLDPDAWRLAVTAAAGASELAFADLDRGDEVTAVLDCTSGWWSEQTWAGTSVAHLLGDARGRSILVRSATGYARRFPMADAGRLLLATRIGGEPLSRRHGSPARLVAPGRRGFWWVKWVVEIEVDDRPWWWQAPFPLT